MTRLSQTLVLTLLGAYVARIALTNEYASYVSARMRWPLLAAGLILVLIAVLSQLMSKPGEGSREAELGHAHSGHDEDHATPRTAWLLAVPFFVIVLIAPQPLGAFVAERRSNQVAAPALDAGFAALPEGTVQLPVTEFVVRALFDPGRSLAEREVELTGFVSKDKSGSGWFVTRISVNCCAADGAAYRVRVLDAAMPQVDSWVTVTGVWEPPVDEIDPQDPTPEDPQIRASSVVSIKAPKIQYE